MELIMGKIAIAHRAVIREVTAYVTVASALLKWVFGNGTEAEAREKVHQARVLVGTDPPDDPAQAPDGPARPNHGGREKPGGR